MAAAVTVSCDAASGAVEADGCCGCSAPAACMPLSDAVTAVWPASAAADAPWAAALRTEVGEALPDASAFTASTRPSSAFCLPAIAVGWVTPETISVGVVVATAPVVPVVVS